MAQYKVIAGTFHVKGFQPDGDSIRFQAINKANWNFLPAAKLNKDGKAQLRIEAIDAMETHYEGYHQPRPFALAALEALLQYLDISSVTYSLGVTKIVDAVDGKPGFIASACVDRYGRPVSYVFPSNTRLADGAVVDSSQLPLERSINFQLAREGLVYPTFYTTTDPMFVEKIRAVVRRARKTKRGIWSIDRTSDFSIWDARTLQDDILILPKLFRRLICFIDSYSNFNELQTYLRKQKDNLQLIDGSKRDSLADLMEFVKATQIRMATPIEDILFSPKD